MKTLQLPLQSAESTQSTAAPKQSCASSAIRTYKPRASISLVISVTLALAFIAFAFADVTSFVDAGRRGLLLYSKNVLPILFPFFFISTLLIELGFFRIFGVKTSVFAISLLCGYPTGSKCLSELYERGEITRTEAIRTATYTSTCSPIFIVATAGTALYNSITIGIIILIAHMFGALLNGLIYCKVNFTSSSFLHYHPEFHSKTQPKNLAPAYKSVTALQTPDIASAVSKSLYSALQNIFAVGGLILVFFIAAAQIENIFNLSPILDIIVSGALEMTNGVFKAAQLGLSPTAACAIVTFGGLCVAMQAFIFLKNFRMPLWFYLTYKATHTILSAAIMCIILIFI